MIMDQRDFTTIYLTSPHGFCAGVKRAVNIANFVLRKHESPVYIKHQLVHNKYVIEDFKKKGAIFIEDLEKIPDKSTVIFSAHGSPPSVYTLARKKKLNVIDATCPLVSKVHLEAKRYEKEGYYILYIGKKNHPEPIGILGEVSDKSIALISNFKEARRIQLPQTNKLIILTQTTLSIDETQEIIKCLRKRFPALILPPSSDICFSTQNRQNAVKALAKKAELILVIGSKESSNSRKLKEVAEKNGAISYLINDRSEIKNEWLKKVKTIGITAGASAPEYLVDDLISYLKKDKSMVIKKLEVILENVNFPLPKKYESQKS